MNSIKLNEICSLQGGYAFKSKDFKNNGTPLVRIGEINNKKIMFNDKTVFIDEEQLNINKNYYIEPNDILIALSGATTGKFAKYTLNQKSLLNQRVLRMRVNKSADFGYVFYYLNILKNQIETNAAGAAQPNISPKEIGTFQIPLPPLPTQRKIVKVLDKAQSLIDKRKEQIELLDELIQSTFYDMFGDPVKNDMGWEVGTIGEVCHFVKDGPHKSLDYCNNGVPFVSVKDIINGYFDLSNVRYISRKLYDEHKKRCEPQKGDILYTKGGTTGYAKLVDVDFEFLNWVHIAVLKFDKKIINGKYFETMLNLPYCYQQSQYRTRGIANRDLVLGEMKKIKLFIPPIALQNQFAQKVEKIEEQKVKLNESLKLMEDNFESLMQRAFRGEL